MTKFIKSARRRSAKAGLPPGTLVHVGEEKTGKVKICVMDYDETEFTEEEVEAVEECFPFKDKPTVTWINVDGVHDPELIEKIGRHFDLHPLLLEDVMNTEQRPKMEDFGEYIFIVLKMLYHEEDPKKQVGIRVEQVSLIIGRNFVISFQEMEGDVFDTIRDRIRNGKGRIRKMGPDYLAYSLIDAVIDNYFLILEGVGEEIEDIQEELVGSPAPTVLHAIHDLKREIVVLRKSIWPLRELVSGLQRSDSDLIDDKTDLYLRDAYDHTIQAVDMIETFRDMLAGMIDIYLSSISNRLNEVMKMLTIIATIFIPLTFIAGVYGMNFEYMPELKWRCGYFLVLGVMLAIAITMLIYFRRKKWL